MSESTLFFKVDGVTYRWEGGFGCQFKSYERRVRAGDCRFINHEVFYAYTVYRRDFFWENDTVNWVAARKIEHSDIAEMRKNFIGG